MLIRSVCSLICLVLSAVQVRAEVAKDFSAKNISSAVDLVRLAPLTIGQHDYRKVQSFLRQIQQRFPQKTEIFSIGTSGTGDQIEGIKIGDGPVHNLIVATHHGNEYGSTEVALYSALNLAENPIPGKTVYVLPVLNISGFNRNSRNESIVGTGGSYANSADANRDYPGPCGTEGPFRLKSTKALADFVADQNIVASATLHSFYPAVVYPWGLSSPDLSTPHEKMFKSLAQWATEWSGYAVGNSTQVIYPADGTFEDYAYWKHGVWSMLFELGKTHSPSDTDISELARVNVPGIRKMLENAPIERALEHGFHGRCDSRLNALDRHDE